MLIHKIKSFFSDINNQIVYAKWVWKQGKQYTAITAQIIITGLLSAIIGILISLIVKVLIDFASTGEFDLKMFIIYGVSLIASEIISAVWDYFAIRYDEKIREDLRRKLLSNILKSKWSEIHGYKIGDLQTRITSDVDKISDGISDLMPSFFIFIIQLILTFFFLLYFSPLIALSAFVIGIVGAFFYLAIKGKIYQHQLRVQEAESIARSHLIESCSNVTAIKSFCTEEKTLSRFDTLQASQYTAVRKKAFVNGRTSFIMNMIFVISYFAAFGIGVYLMSDREISYGTLSLYLVIAGKIQSPMINIAHAIPQIIWMLASAGRLKEIDELCQENESDIKIQGEEFSIEIENLSFSYDEQINPVFVNTSITFNHGEIVGVIGKSGSGKTTLIRLLLAIVRPQGGVLKYISENGTVYQADKNTRALIGYVPQGNMLISGTIAENVCYGLEEATEEEIIEALKIAEAYDFVSKTAKGIHTMLGENGVGLSEGQSQRIAIARAFIRKSSIIIMDEATSALDKETEEKILRNIVNMQKKVTCIFITHREKVLSVCDRVVRVGDGKIVDCTSEYIN